jgi:hypothetical protein
MPTLLLASALAARGEPAGRADLSEAWEQDFQLLQQQIDASDPATPAYRRLHQEALRRDSLIWHTDRDPADVVLRRTRVLVDHLATLDDAPQLDQESRDLQRLARQCEQTPVGDAANRRSLYVRLCELRRRIALQNPLLDFDQILFLTRHRPMRGDHHMVDQYYGHNARPGGSVYVLADPFRRSADCNASPPVARDLLATTTVSAGRLQGQRLTGGAAHTLDLDYDGRTIAFAWTQAAAPPEDASWDGQPWSYQEAVAKGKPYYYWSPETTYHIFRMDVDGGGLLQLTDGPFNEFDPCFLPNGRIAFISERRGGFLRCGDNRPNPTFTLHGMMRDGSDIVPLSLHETHEWNPSVDNNGMIAYTRWDYVDRDNDGAHHIWICYPDGRDPRAYHGNYTHRRELRPWMELGIRAIPNSHRYVAVAAAHHGYAYGSLVLIDQRIEDDGAMSQLRRITPDVHFPESESAPGVPHSQGRHRPKGEVYGTPWPLSEDFYLCVYDSDQRHYALYLVDSFGNRIFIYRDPDVACLDPVPLRPRPRPPIIPNQTVQSAADRYDGSKTEATVNILNVYDADFSWPRDTRISALRVVQLFPKSTYHMDRPMIGMGYESLARGVLGTVPVEEDGSVYFRAPVNVPLYFQALDGDGLAVQSMRSATYVHAGETLSCVGCHERKSRPTHPNRAPTTMAIRRPPSRIAPEASGAFPLTFPRLVQPVLDSQCVRCHDGQQDALDLTDAIAGPHGWSRAYQSLAPFAWSLSGGNGTISLNGSRSIPGHLGARASNLYRLLKKGHHDVQLTDQQLHRITLWLDCNSNFYGAYHDLRQQAEGKLVLPAVQ